MGRYTKRIVMMAICMAVVACVGTHTASAATNKDLSIAPLRAEKIVNAGTSAEGKFKVTNDTESPMVVNLTIKQFSVQDYTYNYTFRDPENKWLLLSDKRVELQPGASKEIDYKVVVPVGAAPGGYYFSMIAGTTVSKGQAFPVTMQVGTLLYLTVDGEITKQAELGESHVPSIVVGRNIPYQFDVRGTGNTHFIAELFAQIGGKQSSQERVVLPNTTRRVEGSVDAPLLPGVYSVTYGYETDFTDEPVTRTAHVVFVPLWSILALIMVAIFAGSLPIQHYRRKRQKANSSQ